MLKIGAVEIRMDNLSQFCFDITHVSSRLPSLSQPSFCVGLLQQGFLIFSITNTKSILMKKGVKNRYMYYDNSHLIENNHLIFHINDNKAHLSSLTN